MQAKVGRNEGVMCIYVLCVYVYMYMSYVYICIIHTHTHTHTHASVWGNSALGRGNSTRCPRVVRRLVERERVKSSRR